MAKKKPEEDVERCGNCRCFLNLDGDGTGLCRLAPPALIHFDEIERTGFFSQPQVQKTGWCWQYKRALQS